tara:strand:+ start:2179 stop:2370 length:192 start_codon:yes stop_codon:yes gene_type:complete
VVFVVGGGGGGGRGGSVGTGIAAAAARLWFSVLVGHVWCGGGGGGGEHWKATFPDDRLSVVLI